jgi:hypothetical protein
MKYFRCNAGDAAYEQARAALDAAWGKPNAQGSQTCIEPAATAPRDTSNRIVLSVHDEFCTYTVAVDLLPQLMASGAVSEIDEATYRAAFPKPPYA